MGLHDKCWKNSRDMWRNLLTVRERVLFAHTCLMAVSESIFTNFSKLPRVTLANEVRVAPASGTESCTDAYRVKSAAFTT